MIDRPRRRIAATPQVPHRAACRGCIYYLRKAREQLAHAGKCSINPLSMACLAEVSVSVSAYWPAASAYRHRNPSAHPGFHFVKKVTALAHDADCRTEYSDKAGDWLAWALVVSSMVRFAGQLVAKEILGCCLPGCLCLSANSLHFAKMTPQRPAVPRPRATATPARDVLIHPLAGPARPTGVGAVAKRDAEALQVFVQRLAVL